MEVSPFFYIFVPMNARKIVVLLVLSMLCFTSKAQNGNGFGFGLRAGVNMSDFTGSTGSIRSSFFGGAFVDYTIKRFGFELGVYYSEQGSSGIATTEVAGNRVNYKIDYIQAQLLAKYQVFNGFRVFVGPESGFLTSARRTYGNVSEKLSNIAKYDLSVVAGVGYSFTFGLDVAASYSRGVFDMFTDASRANTSLFRVTVGWRF